MPILRSAPLPVVLLAACAAGVAASPPSARSPQAAVDELLAADRAFAAAAGGAGLVEGIAAQFAPDVVMPLPGGAWAESAEAATAALRANPGNAGARAEWAPVRGGFSADGTHGFTFGYMTIHGADGAARPAKYLSYWVRRPEGWRVAVYRRAPRPEGAVSFAMLPPALPARMVPPVTDPATLARHAASLDAAERAFSDQAQSIGLGPAFARWGSDDAMNMGRDAAFTLGAAAIGAGMEPGPSPLHWAPDRVLVASSGDLGVTIGRIRPNGPSPAGSPESVPFFTIWRRGPDGEWRYVAE